MALRFQRRQPGNLEVRGVSRQRVSSPENVVDLFENGRLNSVLVQSGNVAYAATHRQTENVYGSNNITIPNALDLPPPIITPPLASPSSDSEFEARGHDWTTGAMTERSSVSWMDEFDKQTTKTVERMFREIDYALYESRESSQSHLLSTSEALGQECEDWSSRFPHMRVVGQLLTTPNSAATKHRDRQTSTPILMGFQERAPRSPSPDELTENGIESETETIFAVDGKGADTTKSTTAFVSAQDESRRSQVSLPSTLHSTRSRMAPSLATGTPILRTREDLIRQLTWETIWPVVARCIRPLLLALKAEKVHSMYSTPAPDASKQVNSGIAGQISSITTSRLAQSRPAAVTAQGTFFTSSARNLGGQLAASQVVANNGSAETQRMLGSLLLISSKQINNRRQETIEPIGSVPPVQFQPVQPLQQQPAPAPMSQSGNRATTSQQQRPTSGMRVPSASARGRLGRGRLHPMERPKTPSQTQQDDYIFDGLRGQKLHTAAELRPQQSGVPVPKNSPLPPLHHSYAGLASSGVGALQGVLGTAQSAGDFLSVAPLVGSAALGRGPTQRAFGASTTSRAPSAAVAHERPLPTFRMASDVFMGPGLTNGINGRPVVGVSQSNNNSLYLFNRSNTLLNVTGVGVIGSGVGPMDEFDRLTAAASGAAGRAPATAIGMARASLVTSAYPGGVSHGGGR